jgi:hypothetical protein
VEAGYNVSAVALPVVGGDEKGTQCLVVQLGQPVTGDAIIHLPNQTPSIVNHVIIIILIII